MEDNMNSFEDFLTHLGTGWWNILYYFTAGLSYFLWAPRTLTMTYFAPSLNYTCLPPDNATNVSEDSCSYVSVDRNGTEVEQPCTDWDFDTSVFTNTLTSEFRLVCSRAYLRATFQSIRTLGTMFSYIVWGILADRYGRKKVVVVTHVLMGILTISMSVLPHLYMIVAFRLMVGMMTNAIAYALAMEVCEIKKRSTVGILIGVPWALGTMAWGGLGYFIRDWRNLNLAISLPYLVIVVVIYFLNESPRWLLVMDRKEEAMRVIDRAARMNKVVLPSPEHTTQLINILEESEPNVPERLRSGRHRLCPPKLLSTPTIRRITAIVNINCFIVSLVFTGLNLSGNMFSASPFLYMVIVGLMELLSYSFVAPVINRWGRKVTSMIGFFICGATMIAVVLVSDDMPWLKLTLVMVGKLALSGAFMIFVLYQVELQPTEVRLQAKGVAMMVGGFGYALAPYITDLLGSMVPWLPSLIFGVSSLVACVLLALLPETSRMPLPDTVHDLDTLWNTKKYEIGKK